MPKTSNTKLQANWRQTTLESLENEYWPSASYPSTLVTRCHELRKIPLSTFRTEDLRIMIGQRIGLKYLVPLAIEVLEEDLFAEGNFFPGDLLQNVLAIDKYFWEQHEEYRLKTNILIKDRRKEIEESRISLGSFESV